MKISLLISVRSYKGGGGAWYRAALANPEGTIQAGGVEKEVTFVEESDPGINDGIDTSYQSKYRHFPEYVSPMVTGEARATTLRLVPRKYTPRKTKERSLDDAGQIWN